MLYKFRRDKMLRFADLHRWAELEDDARFTIAGPIGTAGSCRGYSFSRIAAFVLNGQTIDDASARPAASTRFSSGMMTPKTLSNIFARRIIDQPEHSIFFVGYADPESPAGILRNARARRLGVSSIRTRRPQASALSDRAISVQRARFARIAYRFRRATRAEKDGARSWRSAAVEWMRRGTRPIAALGSHRADAGSGD